MKCATTPLDRGFLAAAFTLAATAAFAAPAAEKAETPDAGEAEAAEWEGIQLAPGVTLGLLAEIEASWAKAGDEKESDITVSKLEIGLSADPVEGVHAEAVLHWEQDEDVEFDTAFVCLGGTEKIPVALEAGRIYAPFGKFETAMVSDPLTLELGETRETLAALTWTGGPLTLWAGAFAGELEKEEKKIENAVAAASVAPCDGLEIGAAFSSDLREGKGYLDDLNDIASSADFGDRVPAVNAWLVWTIADFTLSAEYLGAVDDLEVSMEDEDGVLVATADKPQAWSVEGAYAFLEDWTLALRYEGSKEFQGWPETRWGGTLAWQFNRFASVAAEYLYGTYDDSDLDNAHRLALKLAVEI